VAFFHGWGVVFWFIGEFLRERITYSLWLNRLLITQYCRIKNQAKTYLITS
jgi:hypothetical protein